MASLKILEQPCATFRYRYESELHGAHGHIAGENSKRTNKTLPKVALVDSPASTVIIRCTLAAVEGNNNQQHPHKLVKKSKARVLEYEHHDYYVDESTHFETEFKVGIIQTAKREAEAVLKEKYQRIEKEQKQTKKLTTKETVAINNRAKEEAANVDLNAVRLRFEALHINGLPITDMYGNPLIVFSNPIANSKCASNGDLCITKASRPSGSCTGNEEVMLFVSKVDKKNIKVRFFEEDEDGQTTWEAFGENVSVHHQYGISFQTPPYRNKDIDSDVEVYFQLIRPKDDAVSGERSFVYVPATGGGKKRKIVIDEELMTVTPCTTPSLETYLCNTQDNELVENHPFPGAEFFPDQNNILPVIDIENLGNLANLGGFNLLALMDEDATQTDGPGKRAHPKSEGPAGVKVQDKVWLALAVGDEQELKCLLQDKHEEDARRLLEKPNDQGLAAIHQVARRGNVELLNLVLEYNVDAKAPESCAGRTALHLAVEGGHEAVAKLLIRDVSPVIDYVDWQGRSPLHYAAAAENSKLCELLLDAEADPELCDLEGVSPMHLACENDVIKTLFEKYDLGEKMSKLNL